MVAANMSRISIPVSYTHLNQDREYIRSIAVANALDLVRRYLEAMPAVMAGGELLSEPPPPPVAAIPEAPRKKRSRPRIAAILPWKGDGKAEVFRKCGVLLAIVLLLTAAVLAAYTFWLEPNINRNTYHGIQNEYWNSSGTSLPAVSYTHLDRAGGGARLPGPPVTAALPPQKEVPYERQ